MRRESDTLLERAIAEGAQPLQRRPDDYDALLELVGDARFVLLGESSHGTHEFYRERALITRRLIVEKGFAGVAAEADWPDALRVNRWVRGRSRPNEEGDDAVDCLTDFRRFPQWMWRNADVLDFTGWLREHNDRLSPSRRAGFYGLDLYSLHASMSQVIATLQRLDPPAAERARRRYACFDAYGDDAETYGYAASLGLNPDCEEEVVAELVELIHRRDSGDEWFEAAQNARVAVNAERYYRQMFGGRVSTWNLRDTHMADTLDALADRLSRGGQPARLVVWAHNSHLGDARATQMGAQGEVNLGQLCRVRHPRQVVSIGFTTYRGTVSAASEWSGPVERKRVRPALPGSVEALFHNAGHERFWLDLTSLGEAGGALREPRLERAIGVIYRPETERQSHYFFAELPRQFDAVLHFDETRAVEPLERTAAWEPGELPETYPFSV